MWDTLKKRIAKFRRKYENQEKGQGESSLILNRKGEVCEMQEAASLDASKATFQVKNRHKEPHTVPSSSMTP